MIVGCYDLHLYCAKVLPQMASPVIKGYHGYDEFPAAFTGQTEAEAKREARESGWKFAAGDVICPRCARPSSALGEK